MKRKQTLLTAIVIGGTIGVGAGSVTAHDQRSFSDRSRDTSRYDAPRYSDRSDRPNERYPTQNSDDQSMAPGVPGITEQNESDASRQDVHDIQTALQTEGYDPGRADGVMDENTRAAIRDFQRDNNLVVTGSVDEKTASVLGMS
jgi:sulfite reductase alpha subunit-like flavoprotein